MVDVHLTTGRVIEGRRQPIYIEKEQAKLKQRK
jgi:hypothetical protein